MTGGNVNLYGPCTSFLTLVPTLSGHQLHIHHEHWQKHAGNDSSFLQFIDKVKLLSGCQNN